jgi:hypothetical protein
VGQYETIELHERESSQSRLKSKSDSGRLYPNRNWDFRHIWILKEREHNDDDDNDERRRFPARGPSPSALLILSLLPMDFEDSGIDSDPKTISPVSSY